MAANDAIGLRGEKRGHVRIIIAKEKYINLLKGGGMYDIPAHPGHCFYSIFKVETTIKNAACKTSSKKR